MQSTTSPTVTLNSVLRKSEMLGSRENKTSTSSLSKIDTSENNPRPPIHSSKLISHHSCPLPEIFFAFRKLLDNVSFMGIIKLKVNPSQKLITKSLFFSSPHKYISEHIFVTILETAFFLLTEHVVNFKLRNSHA